jgi:hypothetical protein
MVSICTAKRDAINELNGHPGRFDVLIIDLSGDRPEEWEALDYICGLIGTYAYTPRILCLSMVYRGPRMKLKAERRGARFVYVG